MKKDENFKVTNTCPNELSVEEIIERRVSVSSIRGCNIDEAVENFKNRLLEIQNQIPETMIHIAVPMSISWSISMNIDEKFDYRQLPQFNSAIIEEHEQIRAAREFAEKLEMFLRENLPNTKFSFMILKRADFAGTGYLEECKETHFIKILEGVI